MNACIMMKFIRVDENPGLSKTFYMMMGDSGALCE